MFGVDQRPKPLRNLKGPVAFVFSLGSAFNWLFLLSFAKLICMKEELYQTQKARGEALLHGPAAFLAPERPLPPPLERAPPR